MEVCTPISEYIHIELLIDNDSLAAACCIIASEKFVHEHKLENQAIEIVAQQLSTDFPAAFDSKSAMELVGYSMSKDAADKTFAKAGFREGEGRDLVGVVELHDCFAANEVIVLFLYNYTSVNTRLIGERSSSLIRLWDSVPSTKRIN